jgi:hypothetical protein
MQVNLSTPTRAYLRWWTPCIGLLHGKQLYTRDGKLAVWNTNGYMELIAD